MIAPHRHTRQPHRVGPIRGHRPGHAGGISLAIPPAWVRHAACGDTDPELFFPDHDTPADQLAEANAVCAACPVAAACRDYADHTEAEHGIWAGQTRTPTSVSRVAPVDAEFDAHVLALADQGHSSADIARHLARPLIEVQRARNRAQTRRNRQRRKEAAA